MNTKRIKKFKKAFKRRLNTFLRSREAEMIGKVLFILFVFICFPVGLYLLWKRKKNLPVWLRASVTLVIAAIIVSAVAVSMPRDPYDPGGVEYEKVTPNADVYMPFVPAEDVSITGYTNAYSAESVILLPTATPVPVYVWCNNMGKYYHTETCRYVKETTPRVTLQQALVGGFTPCSECKPPIQ